MKKILIISLCCNLFSFFSCTSKSNITNEVKEYKEDSINIDHKILSCDTSFASADVVIITDETDEQTYYGALFYQENEKKQLLSQGEVVKNPTDIFITNLILKNKITEKALHYLAEYIDNNCDCKAPFIKSDETSVPGLYIFGLQQGAQSKSCFVSLREVDYGLNYFKGLKTWLESSRYKKEYKEFLSYIDGEIADIENQKIKRVGK